MSVRHVGVLPVISISVYIVWALNHVDKGNKGYVFILAKSLFGETGSKDVKRLQLQVDAINAAEPTYQAMSDNDLKQMTAILKGRNEAGESLDDLLVDAFAVVREAAVRALGQRHFDVQLMGGIVLHEGRISEMKTGEENPCGDMAVYLNALTGKGVHVVTVNDYHGGRDAGWMGRVYEFLGLSVGCVIPGIEDDARRAAYQADVTYGTNNEFGFDYLRDNLKFTLEDMVQRDHNFAIVDEVDPILIDEARTPLIISALPKHHRVYISQQTNLLLPCTMMILNVTKKPAA